MKKFKGIIFGLLAAVTAFGLASCENEGPKTYEKTDYNHREIINAEKEEYGAWESHDWGDWVVTKQATVIEEGSRNHTCKVCGHNVTEVIEKVIPVDAGDKGEWGAGEVGKYIDAQEQRNIDINGESAVADYVNYKLASKVEFDSLEIVNTTYASRGLLVVKNEYNRIGFYSLLHNQFLLERMFDEKVLEYTVQTDSVSAIGYVLRITYDDSRLWIDALGNVLFQIHPDDIMLDYPNTYITANVINHRAYAILNVDYQGKGFKQTYFEYQDNGTVEEVTALPYQDNDTNINESPFDKGSQYVDIAKYDLKDFGLEGYYLSSRNNLYTVFKSDNTVVATFAIPANARILIVGQYLIYQNEYQLDDHATTYNFCEGNNKYEMYSYRVDLLTGKKDLLNLDYRITNIVGPYTNKDGVYKYALVQKRTITPAKGLEGAEYALVDELGIIVSNLNGYNPNSFVKVGNNFYNTATRVLYDSNLKEIAYLGGMNPTLIRKHNCFLGQVQGHYGLVDSTGKVIVAFDYDSIDYSYEVNGFAFGFKNGHLFRINMADGSETDLGNHYGMFDNNNHYLYIVRSDENGAYTFEFTTGRLGEDALECNMLYSVGTGLSNDFLSYLFFKYENTRYVEEEVENEDPDSDEIEVEDVLHSFYGYVGISINRVANYESFEPYGEEVEFEEVLGVTRDEAQTLKLGSNKMYFTRDNNFFSFTPAETGYYTLEKEYKERRIYVSRLTTADNENQNNYVYEEEFGYVFLLQGGVEYIIELNTNYYTRTVFLELTQELGEHQNYPFVHNLDGSKELKYYEDGTYVRLYSRNAGYYTFSNPDNVKYYVISGGNLQTVNNPYDEEDETKYFRFNEFTTYLLKFVKDTTQEKETFVFDVNFAESDELNPLGNSQLKPHVLALGDNEVTVGNLKYYVYTNATAKDQLLKVSSYNLNMNFVTYTYDQYLGGNQAMNPVVNGGVIEVEAGQKLVFRVHDHVVDDNVDYMIRLEEVVTPLEFENNLLEFSGNSSKTYYFKGSQYNTRLYTIKVISDAAVNVKLYDLYGDLYCNITKDADDEELNINMYLEQNVVYKMVIEATQYYEVHMNYYQYNSYDHYTQVITEDNHNRVYMPYYNNQNYLTYLVFEAKETADYLFKTNSNFGALYYRTLKDSSSNRKELYNTYGYYKVHLEAGKIYVFEVISYNEGLHIISLQKDLGQEQSSPVVMKENSNFDAKLNFLDQGMKYDFYATFYPRYSGTYEFTGFDRYKVPNGVFTAMPEDNKVELVAGNIVLLHATITEKNYTLLVKFDLTDKKDGETPYNAIPATLTEEGKLELPLVADVNPVYYSFTNAVNETVFVENAPTLPTGTDLGYSLGKGDEVLELKPYVPVKTGETLYVKVSGTSEDEGAKVVFNTSKENDYFNFTAFELTLPTTVEEVETNTISKEILLSEPKFVKVVFNKTSEGEDDELKAIIRRDDVNSAPVNINFNADTKKGEYYTTIEAYRKHLLVLEGKGTYSVAFEFVGYITDVQEDKFQEVNGVFTSLNKDKSTDGSMGILILSDSANLSFDYKIDAGDGDYMIVSYYVNGVYTTKTIYGPEYEGTINLTGLSKDDPVVVITYHRSSNAAEGANKLVISNIEWELA